MPRGQSPFLKQPWPVTDRGHGHQQMAAGCSALLSTLQNCQWGSKGISRPTWAPVQLSRSFAYQFLLVCSRGVSKPPSDCFAICQKWQLALSPGYLSMHCPSIMRITHVYCMPLSLGVSPRLVLLWPQRPVIRNCHPLSDFGPLAIAEYS